jgi:hypothetical protein
VCVDAEAKGKMTMAKKKKFEFVGVGRPTDKYSSSAGIPVTYICDGSPKTVYVFGLHPSDVMDRDAEDCEVIGDQELAEDAIASVKSLWQWFSDQRDYAVNDYLYRKNEQEQREKRTTADRQPSKPVNREKLLETCLTEL